jgi:Ca2+-binding EF-hand superfamily protein
MAAPSRTDTRQLHSLLQELAEIERKCEIKRQVLSEHRAFNADSLYSFLARSSARGITPEDLQGFFSAHGLSAELRDLNALIALFDHNGDGVVDRQEFKETVLSHEQGFSDGTESRQEPPFEVQVSLLKLLDEELGGVRVVEQARAAIRSHGQQHLLELFDMLDAGRKGFVDVRDIYELLNRHEAGSTYTKASRVLRRLDRDRDNKVSLEEWEASFDPRAYTDNIFRAIAPQKRESSAKKTQTQVRGGFEPRERTPVSEVSYNITPAHPRSAAAYLNSGTLAYSRSPHRKNYSPTAGSAFKSPPRRTPAERDARQSTSQLARARPSSDVVYHDVVTVLDRSPDRSEKRTYISKKFADGTVEKEERIYEPLPRSELRAREPEYRLERSIVERDRSTATKRPHLTSHKKPADTVATASRLRVEPPARRERSPLRIARPGLPSEQEQERPHERLERTLRANSELPPGFLRGPHHAPTTSLEETLFIERDERFVDPRYTLDYDNAPPAERSLGKQPSRQFSPNAARWQHSPIKHLSVVENRFKPVSPPSRLDGSQLERKPEHSRLQKNQLLESSGARRTTSQPSEKKAASSSAGTTTATKSESSTRLRVMPPCTTELTEEKRSPQSPPDRPPTCLSLRSGRSSH